ncbi:ATP-dependent helicase HrpB [Paenibacillus sp. LMG 31461]|uniref:ATP-dependent helicase HrpB n=1 Tax=Paenibacillus plantarum TaxID=2654975 RepID=A0ABX1X9S4_9BACL|nr:ATP-dependent helicase HrpB [Paenibacillus plantarum]NOU64941.1 ATP-dependent helicase HrpB [Paenibacillus plantarum]
MNVLPINAILSQLVHTLQERTCAIVVAQPGAGKTTQVPLALLEAAWLQGQKILMLEPRRLAARAAARYMAKLLGEEVGKTIGYRVKNDTRVGPQTRIEVITEGVLTRMLQSDPALDGVGIVIFDEFHERSLHADIGLALCRQSQTLLRDDLRILLMSATLEANAISLLLDDAPIIESEGRTYPVDTHYLQQKIVGRIEPAVVASIGQALQAHAGSILVFLPGAAEIHRVANGLAALRLGHTVEIAPLYANLSIEDQDQALAAVRTPGHRKIVLATSIAETSLTVEGITVVIDSGLMRVPRFSPRTGMTRLTTVPVSVASADQRRGRAGRLGPGACYRLWTETEHRQLPPSSTPEIREADLAPLALELAAWGAPDPAALVWLDPPPAAAYQQARELLVQLGALHENGGLTPHGKRVAALGLHPRLAHMVLQAVPLELGALACELAVMLSERDFMRAASRDADVRSRIEELWRAQRGDAREGVDLDLCRRITAEAKVLMQSLGIRPSVSSAAASGLLLAFAFPDRVAQRRSVGRFTLANGRGAVLPELQPLSNERYIVAAELDDSGTESRIYLAAPLQEEELFTAFDNHIRKEQVVEWDSTVGSVRARELWLLGALTLKDKPLQEPNPDLVLQAMIAGIRSESLDVLPWTRNARQLQERSIFLHRFTENWPDLRNETLLATLEEWAGPHLYGLKSKGALSRLNLTSLLEEMLTWEQRRSLDEWAPTHIQVPSGSRIPVDYSNLESPTLSVRLQEMFGLADTPCIAKGRVPVTLHLLSPAQRPMQVTKDLASFWREAYFEVKKDLKGRYPKHYWPDDPMAAIPTNRAKPRT